MLAALALAFASTASATNVLLSNDDGWAVANIRATNDALKAAGYDVCDRQLHCFEVRAGFLIS
jgi:5'-nucleotidase